MLTNVFEPKRSIESSALPSLSSSVSSLQLSLNWCATSTVIGSAFVEFGGSKLFALVQVLRPSVGKGNVHDQGQLICAVSFSSHLANANAENYSNDLRSRLHEALYPSLLLQNYPKSSISINVKILQSSSFDLAASINACSAALCQAGIEMKDILTAVCLETALKTNNPGKNRQLQSTVASLSSLDEVCYLDVNGEVTAEEFQQLIVASQEQCKQIRQTIATRIAKS